MKSRSILSFSVQINSPSTHMDALDAIAYFPLPHKKSIYQQLFTQYKISREFIPQKGSVCDPNPYVPTIPRNCSCGTHDSNGNPSSRFFKLRVKGGLKEHEISSRNVKYSKLRQFKHTLHERQIHRPWVVVSASSGQYLHKQIHRQHSRSPVSVPHK